MPAVILQSFKIRIIFLKYSSSLHWTKALLIHENVFVGEMSGSKKYFNPFPLYLLIYIDHKFISEKWPILWRFAMLWILVFPLFSLRPPLDRGLPPRRRRRRVVCYLHTLKNMYCEEETGTYILTPMYMWQYMYNNVNIDDQSMYMQSIPKIILVPMQRTYQIPIINP